MHKPSFAFPIDYVKFSRLVLPGPPKSALNRLLVVKPASALERRPLRLLIKKKEKKKKKKVKSHLQSLVDKVKKRKNNLKHGVECAGPLLFQF